MHFKAILFTQQTPQAPSYYCTDISTTPQRYKNKWFGGSRSIIIPLNVLPGGRERTYDLPLAICVRHLDKSQARWYIFVPGRRKGRDRWSFESLHELPRLYFEWVIYITSYYNRRSIFAPPLKKIHPTFGDIRVRKTRLRIQHRLSYFAPTSLQTLRSTTLGGNCVHLPWLWDGICTSPRAACLPRKDPALPSGPGELRASFAESGKITPWSRCVASDRDSGIINHTCQCEYSRLSPTLFIIVFIESFFIAMKNNKFYFIAKGIRWRLEAPTSREDALRGCQDSDWTSGAGHAYG